MPDNTDQLDQFKERLKAAIDAGDSGQGIQLAEDALADGMGPLAFFQDVIQPVLEDLGERFSRLDVFLPDLMKAGMVVKAIQTEVLEGEIRDRAERGPAPGVVVIGTTQGDLHDIGKNMVALMLQVNGFKVIDLGVDVSPKTFLETAQKEGADIIAMSSLLTTSLPFIKDVIARASALGLRDRFKLIAGGAPVNQEWARSVNLDGYGEDAVEAVAVCRRLLEEG
jgi:trimethylamine corrinoid protein